MRTFSINSTFPCFFAYTNKPTATGSNNVIMSSSAWYFIAALPVVAVLVSDDFRCIAASVVPNSSTELLSIGTEFTISVFLPKSAQTPSYMVSLFSSFLFINILHRNSLIRDDGNGKIHVPSGLFFISKKEVSSCWTCFSIWDPETSSGWHFLSFWPTPTLEKTLHFLYKQPFSWCIRH